MQTRLALLIYYTRDEWPLRGSIASHIRAFRHWPGFQVVPVNVAFPFDLATLRALPFDLIIYHTTAVALRWYPSGIEALNPLALAFANHKAFKIALPQDDYMFTGPLCAWLNRARIDLVLTPISGVARALAYATLDHDHARLETILTSYLERDDIAQARTRKHIPYALRAFDVAYRAWDARPWVGAVGQLKKRVGSEAAAACQRLGLLSDVSTNPKDTIMGDAWFDFLGNTRAVVGVEGGSSIHDPDGSIFKAVEAYMVDYPDASYVQIVDAVLQGHDDQARFTALSPRHLEAVFTRTAQILVEGDYNGVLKPDVHYIPIKADFSDMDQAISKLSDARAIETMIQTAWNDIVEGETYLWETFLTTIAVKHVPERHEAISFGVLARTQAFVLRDAFNFALLRLELAWSRTPARVKSTLSVVFRPVRFLLNRPPGWR
jgi:hypothetical protein